MRKAGDKLKEMFGTLQGQDIIETTLGAGIAAGGQAIFTDMTPEEIALATSLGVGAAVIGRPLGGRAGKFIGNKIAAHSPGADRNSQQFMNFIRNNQPTEMLREIYETKLKPYSDLRPTAQLGAMYGRSRGDNIVQGAVALASPLLFAGEDDA